MANELVLTELKKKTKKKGPYALMQKCGDLFVSLKSLESYLQIMT